MPCCSRRGTHSRLHAEEEGPIDPDNLPARSRLFLVVPKAADGAVIEVCLQPEGVPGNSCRLLQYVLIPPCAPAVSKHVWLQAHLASFQDLQYCKIDLIATKGVVFCKYARSSSALAALEAVTETGMVSSPDNPAHITSVSAASGYPQSIVDLSALGRTECNALLSRLQAVPCCCKLYQADM